MYKYTAWLVHNGSLNSPKFDEIHQLYATAAKNKSVELKLVKNNDIYSLISNNNIEVSAKFNFVKPDFIIFLDKDIRLAKHLELAGFKVFNSSYSIENCDDKISSYQILSNNNIKLPKTIISHKIYNSREETNDSFLSFVEEQLGFPMVIKEAFGSFGAQVYLVNNRNELVEKYAELMYKPHLFQEFIKSSNGRDVRIHVIGDRVVASMLRKSETDFRANISNGGSMEKFDPPESFKEMAIKVSNLLKCDFSGVDILFGENNEPVLCEINSNAHIKNILDCTGINVAEHILDYIINKI